MERPRDRPGEPERGPAADADHDRSPRRSATATELFTRYLAANSKRWRNGPGHGVTISWPSRTGESDDDSLRATIAETPGSIGYTDQDTALQNHLDTAHLGNPSGQYIGPSLHAIGAAGQQPHSPGDLSLTTIDARVPDAYPASAKMYRADGTRRLQRRAFASAGDGGPARARLHAWAGAAPGQAVLVRAVTGRAALRRARRGAAPAVRRPGDLARAHVGGHWLSSMPASQRAYSTPFRRSYCARIVSFSASIEPSA